MTEPDAMSEHLYRLIRKAIRDHEAERQSAKASAELPEHELLSIRDATTEFHVGRRDLMEAYRRGTLAGESRRCPGGNIGVFFARSELRRFYPTRGASVRPSAA